ncbi:MAG: hypothetical protein Q9183_004018 [Haloplaca sp. 2 TL-2023]
MSSKSGPQIKRKSVPLIGKSAESFQIGPLSPSISDSLTNGTSIPPPDPPTPPAKNEESTMMRPSTPSQQPVQQGQLSDATYHRFFPSTSSPESMPGAFPSEGQPQPEEEDPVPQRQTTPKLQRMGYEVSASASPSPYAPSSSRPSASPSQSTRRPSSVFRLLPFKRKAAGNDSDSTFSARPQTPGAESVMGSLADSGAGGSLRKKRSGFWGRRKSSLSHVIGSDGAGEGAAQRRAVSSGYTGPSGEAQGGWDGEEEFPPRLKKKKSLTFWRRGSSLGLDKMGSGYEQQQQQQQSRPQQQHRSGENGISGVNDLMGVNGGASNGYHHDEDTEMGEPDRITLRPRSPPPQLPEVGHVVQEQGGLMGEEDWFGNIR